jgi:hypothetical protein
VEHNQSATNGHSHSHSFARDAAENELVEICAGISVTPPAIMEETLRHAIPFVREKVDLGLVDKAEAVDRLQNACDASGVIAERGPDWVQRILADGFKPTAANVTSEVRAWPELSAEAKRGLIGEIASLATAHSEADPVAIMLTMLTATGALMGRARFVRVGDTNHHARLFCALVGDTSRARKGTSLGPVQRILGEAERAIRAKSTLPFPAGIPLKIRHGLSSGEGLVAEIRDKRDEKDEVATEDKRLLIVEGEFGAVLRMFQRQGNTLSTMLRTSWDGSDLGVMTKHNRDKATDPHICIVAHITRRELSALLNETDVFGGLVNRIAWGCVRRPKIVPCPRRIDDQDAARLAGELARVTAHSHEHPGELRMSNSATELWVHVYPELTMDRSGLFGAATARAEAQTLRLALTYALLDGSDRLEQHHLEAGLAMWRYADDSARYLFGGLDDIDLDPVTQKILGALARGPKTQTEIVDLFSRNLPPRKLPTVLADLQERGFIAATKRPTAGRPQTVWQLASLNEKNERNELWN